MTSLTSIQDLISIQDPEDKQDIEAKKRERATLISAKQAEKLRICGGQGDDGSYVKGALAEEISHLQNTCVITGRPCEMEQTDQWKNWRGEHESREECKNCDKQTTRGGGRKKKTRRKKEA